MANKTNLKLTWTSKDQRALLEPVGVLEGTSAEYANRSSGGRMQAAGPPVQALFLGQSGQEASETGAFEPILALFSLAIPGRGAIIPVTHSPCLSRFAVTHIKGEFFYCPDQKHGHRHRSLGLSRKEQA